MKRLPLIDLKEVSYAHQAIHLFRKTEEKKLLFIYTEKTNIVK